MAIYSRIAYGTGLERAKGYRNACRGSNRAVCGFDGQKWVFYRVFLGRAVGASPEPNFATGERRFLGEAGGWYGRPITALTSLYRLLTLKYIKLYRLTAGKALKGSKFTLSGGGKELIC